MPTIKAIFDYHSNLWANAKAGDTKEVTTPILEQLMADRPNGFQIVLPRELGEVKQPDVKAEKDEAEEVKADVKAEKDEAEEVKAEAKAKKDEAEEVKAEAKAKKK